MDKSKEAAIENTVTDHNRLMNLHLVMIVVASIGGCGLVIEGSLLSWEFWMLPLVAVGTVVMWVLYILQIYTPGIREKYYVVFIISIAFFHGMHSTSFFDVSLLTMLMMITFTGADNKRYQDYAMIEYIVVEFAQFYLAIREGGIPTDTISVSRIILHIIAVVITYNICRTNVDRRLMMKERIEVSAEMAANANEGIEDFLANISHEFRTPINVVTGMSSLLMKESDDDRIISINEAGNRLAHQIGDILDYNEILSGRIILNKDRYEITTIISEAVRVSRVFVARKGLELIVDLDPNIPRVLVGDLARIRKIIFHLLSNAHKFTDEGGMYLGITAVKREYGINLDIEVTDTGRGMTDDEMASLKGVLFQADTSRDRSTGGIGLGLTLVYGFAHAMNGFVHIGSSPGHGTTVRVSIPHDVVDPAPTLSIEQGAGRCIVVYVRTEKYRIPEIREFYHRMIDNISRGTKAPIHNVTTLKNLKNTCERMEVTNLFMGQEEYDEDRQYFNELSRKFCVAVNAADSFEIDRDSNIIRVPKPIYGLSIVNIINAGDTYGKVMVDEAKARPVFRGVRALVVDDEVLNLVVAAGLFKDYGMVIDTAESGAEAVNKYNTYDYDIVFMDHMMPQMDGVEAMKRLRAIDKKKGRDIPMIALTANAVSGAREMFLSEGFDGFIAKPIELGDFEVVMRRVLSPSMITYREGGDDR